MRCGRGCSGRVAPAWLVTGPTLNQRVRPRRVALLGVDPNGITKYAQPQSRQSRYGLLHAEERE
jgi:hypothetical protein